MMRDLTVEQYHMIYPEWYGPVLNQPRGECPVSFTPLMKGKNEPHLKYAYHCSCLVSDYTILLSLYCSAHVSFSQFKNMLTFKTVLRKIRDKYQAYCTSYKMHAMATHHRGAGCTLDRGIDLNAEEPEPTDIDNESTHTSDATVALGGPEAAGHCEDPVYSNHNKLSALMREINDLHQRVEAGGQPAESLDYIECKLQNLMIALNPPPPTTPTEPFGEVICQYTNTLCTTQKQINLANGLLQDIAVFNE